MITVVGQNVVDTDTGEVLGKPVTDKQMKVIKMIESNLNINFSGYTYQDAWKFIGENMEKSRQARAKQTVTRRTERACRIDYIDTACGISALSRHLDAAVGSKYVGLFSDEDMEDGFF